MSQTRRSAVQQHPTSEYVELRLRMSTANHVLSAEFHTSVSCPNDEKQITNWLCNIRLDSEEMNPMHQERSKYGSIVPLCHSYITTVTSKQSVNQPTNQLTTKINQLKMSWSWRYHVLCIIIRPALSCRRAFQQTSQQNTVNNQRKMKPKYTLKCGIRWHFTNLHNDQTSVNAMNKMSLNNYHFAICWQLYVWCPSTGNLAVCHSWKCNTGLGKNRMWLIITLTPSRSPLHFSFSNSLPTYCSVYFVFLT